MSLEDKDVDTLNNEELDQNTDTNVDTDNTDTGTDDLDSVDDSEVESDIDSDTNSEDNDSSNVKDLSYGKQFWKRQIESFLELIKKDGNDIDVKDKEDCILTGKKLIETLTK